MTERRDADAVKVSESKERLDYYSYYGHSGGFPTPPIEPHVWLRPYVVGAFNYLQESLERRREGSLGDRVKPLSLAVKRVFETLKIKRY